MEPYGRPHDDTIPPVPPPPSEFENVWLEPLQSFDPGNDPLIAIACQPMSNLTTEGCSGDEHTLGIEGEEGELSVGSIGSSIFSATSSSDRASSVETAITENGYPAEITVTVDVQVHTTHAIERDEVVPGDRVRSVDGSYLSLPSRAVIEAIDESYTLVRLTSMRHGEILQRPDEGIGSISDPPSITPLNDGSWEMLVLKSCLPALQRRLSDMYQIFSLDLKYDPLEPTPDDVEYWGLDPARVLCMFWFMERAGSMVRRSWYIAQVYYTHLIKEKTRGKRMRLSCEGLIVIWDKAWTRKASSIHRNRSV